MRFLVQRSATSGFAISTEAGLAAFGQGWGTDARWSILRRGIDLKPYHEPRRTLIREELDIPRDAFVIGHVGRFVESENQEFLITIAMSAALKGTNVHFLLIGDGPLRGELERRLAAGALQNKFTFGGQRNDVPTTLTSAMDAFVLPSSSEDLPVVLIEAQASGLPCLVSDNVSAESKIVPSLFFQESLGASPDIWAERLLGLRSIRNTIEPQSALRTVEDSAFNVKSNLELLHTLYLHYLGRKSPPLKPSASSLNSESSSMQMIAPSFSDTAIL